MPGLRVGDPAAPPRPTIAATGALIALIASAVLVSWVMGDAGPAALVPGWRVMVPGTAFVFTCLGLGLLTHAAGGERLSRYGPALFAALAAVIPVLTLIEYATGWRFGVEHLIAGQFPAGDPVAGRMSPVTSLATTTLALSLAGLRWRGAVAETIVRLAAGTTLTLSWLAVLALSFDASRLADRPGFPSMAVLTVILLSLSSIAVIASSQHAMARLRGAHLHAAVAPGTIVAAFAVPLVLGQVRALLQQWLDPALTAAAVVMTFALAITAVVWRTLARLQAFQRQRDRLLADLEGRVDDRTLALAIANRQLHYSEARLREADRRKDEFLATLSHELRNPLAPIRTGLAILRLQEGPTAAAQSAHQVISRQMQQLVRLIDDLLDVSRITANKLDLRLEPVDVRDVVQHGIETSRPDVDRHHHELTLDLPAEPLFVTGDPARLTQVVANLVQNACKYTPRGGHIAVAVAERGGRVELRVRDDGIGIAPEHMPLLFETFSQVAPGTARGGGGLGLGLALVRGLVSLHGGEVDVRSEGVGRGAEFIVRLNLAAPTRPGALEPVTPAPPRGPSRRVLVVDDNVDNADALTALLQQWGHDVHAAYDGAQALRIAATLRPDVVLLDLGLPSLSGHDVCRQLRAEPWARRTVIVAQTGWGQRSDRIRSRQAGFDAHLVKPVDPVALQTLLAAPRTDGEGAAAAPATAGMRATAIDPADGVI